MVISKKIRQRRRLLGISQNDLSKRVGVSLKTIQRWENEERSPRAEEIGKLSDALGTSVEYLMGLSDDDTTEAHITEKQYTEYLDIGYWEKVLSNAFSLALSHDIQTIAEASRLLNLALYNLKEVSNRSKEFHEEVSASQLSAYNGNNSIYKGNTLNT